MKMMLALQCVPISISPALWTPLVSLLHGDKIRTPQSARSTSGQEQPSKPIVTIDSRCPARKEAGGTEEGGSLHNIGAAVYCQVFTLCEMPQKRRERRGRIERTASQMVECWVRGGKERVRKKKKKMARNGKHY